LFKVDTQFWKLPSTFGFKTIERLTEALGSSGKPKVSLAPFSEQFSPHSITNLLSMGAFLMRCLAKMISSSFPQNPFIFTNFRLCVMLSCSSLFSQNMDVGYGNSHSEGPLLLGLWKRNKRFEVRTNVYVYVSVCTLQEQKNEEKKRTLENPTYWNTDTKSLQMGA